MGALMKFGASLLSSVVPGVAALKTEPQPQSQSYEESKSQLLADKKPGNDASDIIGR
ncbi:hypothetical protein BCF11_2720 [Collimonas sp. PA-H2]|uniref:hypothetical protein n=1 Tax=Collimonas sp. PA-H2 TaxID=1881062 RepID=UPI000C002378|nr:hypothetical protein [Collimonas sp. PA-H2]PFH10302.1 hypothetical protein BCF11_2720 [Collimonas sp. PA-H2]